MTVRENLELGAYQRKDKAEIREDMVKDVYKRQVSTRGPVKLKYL